MTTRSPSPPDLEPQPEAVQPIGLESRSIDYVPSSERHGKVSHLGPLWFVSNINLTAMATGVAALSIGAGLMWTVVATVIGSLFGTFFMAFHSAQGPQLGLPQLVQSRPQFGYVGAAVTVWVFALVNYVAYNTSDALLSGAAFNTLVGVPTGWATSSRRRSRPDRPVRLPLDPPGQPVAELAAHGDHGRPHRRGALRRPAAAGAFSFGEFKPAAFMTVFVIVAGFQLGWAPYVSDYSRYLPADVGVRATFWWTYLASGLSAIWVFVLGAVMPAAGPDAADPVAAFRGAGDRLFGGFGWIAVLALLLGLLSVMAINQYGGMMSMISIRDSFKPVGPAPAAGSGSPSCSSSSGASPSSSASTASTPSTATCSSSSPTCSRRGRRSTSSTTSSCAGATTSSPRSSRREGIYGRWGWRGNVAYLDRLAVMVPFMVTTPFTGFVAKALGGVDYSIFIGLPVAGLLYMYLSATWTWPTRRPGRGGRDPPRCPTEAPDLVLRAHGSTLAQRAGSGAPPDAVAVRGTHRLRRGRGRRARPRRARDPGRRHRRRARPAGLPGQPRPRPVRRPQADRVWLNDLAGKAAYLDAVAAYAAANPDEPWIVGGGWAMEFFPGGTPRKEDLDAVVPDRRSSSSTATSTARG